MTFLSPLLLALAAFAALPLLLHLIRRKRVRILDLPTFRFLKKAALEQRFHLRLQDQFLMILRMLVLVLLALAFAGPLTSRTPPAEQPVLGVRNVLLLDDSLSMSAGGENSPFSDSVLLAQALLAKAGSEWRIVTVSQVVSSDDPLADAAGDLETLEGSLRRLGPPRYVGPVLPALSRLRAAVDPETTLWIATDRTASNWEGLADSSGSDVWAELLLMGPSDERPNFALSRLELRNSPLLPGESALLSVGFRSFSPAGCGPSAIRLTWKDSELEKERVEVFPIPQGSSAGGEFESVLASTGRIQTVSAALEFPPDSMDALPGDNQRFVSPAYLDPIPTTLIAEGPSARWLLAALKDFSPLLYGPSDPIPPQAAQTGVFVVLLSDRLPSNDWMRMMEQSVSGGAGMLVLYDRSPDGLRLGNWADWWTFWGATATLDRVAEGGFQLKSGTPEWLAESLDPASHSVDWGGGGFSLYSLDETPVELSAGTSDGRELPLFQWINYREGGVGAWTVPLHPEETKLILNPGWVPLLSQLVKRTRIDPSAFVEGAVDERSGLESDLTPLSPEDVLRLRSAGLRCSEGLSILENLGNVPTRQQDWTTVLAALCLLVAVIELTISNLA